MNDLENPAHAHSAVAVGMIVVLDVLGLPLRRNLGAPDEKIAEITTDSRQFACTLGKHSGQAGVIGERIGLAARGRALFVFFGKRGDAIKSLFFDGVGMRVSLGHSTAGHPACRMPGRAMHVAANEPISPPQCRTLLHSMRLAPHYEGVVVSAIGTDHIVRVWLRQKGGQASGPDWLDPNSLDHCHSQSPRRRLPQAEDRPLSGGVK